MAHIHEYVSLQKSGVLRLPGNVREKLRLDEPGAQGEIEETEDGHWQVHFFNVPIGIIDQKTRKLRRCTSAATQRTEP